MISVVVILGIIALAFVYLNVDEKVVQDSTKQNVIEVIATTSEIKTFTMEEVSLHNNKTDCWMAINQDVLNVTSFVDKHPGGDRILEGCGKDATEYFNKVPQHLKGIVKMIYQKLIIGKLEK